MLRRVRSGVRRRAWRAWYRTRWLAWDQRQTTQTRIRRVAGIELLIIPGVLDPALFFSSELLVASIHRLVTPGATVLDLGTGSGIGAIAAAEAGAAQVVAVDIQTAAVDCCRANIARHRLEDRVDVRQGDLFDPVPAERFDLVAFNPPYLRPPAKGASDPAFHGPPELAARFATGVADHLTPTGSAVVVLSTNGRPEDHLAPLRAAGFRVIVLLSRDRGSERLTSWHATLAREADDGAPSSITDRAAR